MKLKFKTLTVGVLAALATTAAQAADLQPYGHKGQVIQRLSSFDNPEGAIFSADGKYVFISNAAEQGNAEKGFAWTRGAGYVSKLEVQEDGTLKIVDDKLITGLTAPLGFAVNPVGTKKFPKGSIFLVQATAPLVEADGTPVKDASGLNPKITAFDVDGKVLGEIKLGAGSAAEKAAGVIATLGNALAFDKSGNLYLAETGIAGGSFEPALPTKGGGIYLLPHGALDDLADGKDAKISYLPVPEGGPDGIEVGPDGKIHFNTVGVAGGLKDPAEGGQYRVTKKDIESGKLPEPYGKGFGALDGLVFAGKARLDTEIKNTSSVVVTDAKGKASALTYDQDIKLAGPADIAAHKQRDGSYLLVIPELSATSPNNNDNTVTVVRLPKGFDKP
jgi:DNA-binding beta-propeller fold protein YncE